MKTVISQDDQLRMIYSDDPNDAKISLCNEHHDKLLEKMKLHKIEKYVSKSEQELLAKIRMKEIDPLFASTEALIRLAMNTIGSEGVVMHRCPVCALNKFDFIAQVAKAFRDVIAHRESQRNEQ